MERLARQFGNIRALTENQLNNLTLFTKNGLRNPNLVRYAPVTINSGFCFPNNDPISRVDLGYD
ncbi:hypothetical protein [Aquimarina sp. 2304DJ70-9]|uniref:hypothetical protein n=1 Tax=Aquimarina penaris TaxID=3231044 RepID=UPI00346360C9